MNVNQKAFANVTITVIRNKNPPIFTQNVYTGSLWEKATLPYYPLSTLVSATDADGVSLVCPLQHTLGLYYTALFGIPAMKSQKKYKIGLQIVECRSENTLFCAYCFNIFMGLQTNTHILFGFAICSAAIYKQCIYLNDVPHLNYRQIYYICDDISRSDVIVET